MYVHVCLCLYVYIYVCMCMFTYTYGRSEIFHICPDWPWGQTSLLYNEYSVFPGGKGPGCGGDHPPPSSAVVKKE